MASHWQSQMTSVLNFLVSEPVVQYKHPVITSGSNTPLQLDFALNHGIQAISGLWLFFKRTKRNNTNRMTP
jgi:hypothetical protein